MSVLNTCQWLFRLSYFSHFVGLHVLTDIMCAHDEIGWILNLQYYHTMHWWLLYYVAEVQSFGIKGQHHKTNRSQVEVFDQQGKGNTKVISYVIDLDKLPLSVYLHNLRVYVHVITSVVCSSSGPCTTAVVYTNCRNWQLHNNNYGFVVYAR